MAGEKSVPERVCREPQWIRTIIFDSINLPPHLVPPAIHQNLLLGRQEHHVSRLAHRKSTRRKPSNTPQMHPILQHPLLSRIILQNPSTHPIPRNPNHRHQPLQLQQINPPRELARNHLLRHRNLPPNPISQVKSKHIRATVRQPMQCAIKKYDLIPIHVSKLLVNIGNKFVP